MLLLVSGFLLTLVCYYIKQIWEGLQKLNDNFTKCFELFAPKGETGCRLDDLEDAVGEHGARISVLEDWRKRDEHQVFAHNIKAKEADNGI